jgi:hypothetical protein
VYSLPHPALYALKPDPEPETEPELALRGPRKYSLKLARRAMI